MDQAKQLYNDAKAFYEGETVGTNSLIIITAAEMYPRLSQMAALTALATEVFYALATQHMEVCGAL